MKKYLSEQEIRNHFEKYDALISQIGKDMVCYRSKDCADWARWVEDLRKSIERLEKRIEKLEK